MSLALLERHQGHIAVHSALEECQEACPEPRDHCGPEEMQGGQEKAGEQEVMGVVLHFPEIFFKRFAQRELLLTEAEEDP